MRMTGEPPPLPMVPQRKMSTRDMILVMACFAPGRAFVGDVAPIGGRWHLLVGPEGTSR
jgi:hypothetical protein